MTFCNLQAAYLYFFATLLFIFYLIGDKKNKKAAGNLAQKEFSGELLSSLDTRKRKIKNILFFAAFIFCILALMRPQYGLHGEDIKKSGIDIMIAIDTSKSMLSEDIKPNRLEVSKAKVRELVKKLKGDRVGLVAFSGTAFPVCPLTIDYNAFMFSLDSLDVNTIPRGGTSISGAIIEAQKGFNGSQSKRNVLIIMTDGEDHEGGAVKAARAIRKEGITIFAIGVGTADGALVPIIGDNGQKTFLKDRQGNIIKSRLDEAVIKEIALITGGDYMKASEPESGLERIYDEKISKMEGSEIKGGMRKHYKEWFQFPLLLAIIFLVCETVITERKKSG